MAEQVCSPSDCDTAIDCCIHKLTIVSSIAYPTGDASFEGIDDGLRDRTDRQQMVLYRSSFE